MMLETKLSETAIEAFVELLPRKGHVIELDPDQLDNVLDFVRELHANTRNAIFHLLVGGKGVRGNVWSEGTIKTLRGGDMLVVEIELHCCRCRAPIKGPHYAMSGLHNGAWCYLCDKYGEWMADLRDQVPVCSKCRKE